MIDTRMMLKRFIVSLFLFLFFTNSVRAEVIHSVPLHQKRMTEALHQALRTEFAEKDYRLDYEMTTRESQKAEGEAIRIKEANGELKKGERYLFSATETLGGTGHEIVKVRLSLEILPQITEEKAKKLQALLSEVAKLDAKRGDEIHLRATLVETAQTEPAATTAAATQSDDGMLTLAGTETALEGEEQIAQAAFERAIAEGAMDRKTDSASTEETQAGVGFEPWHLSALALIPLAWLTLRKKKNPIEPTPDQATLRANTKSPLDLLDEIDQKEGFEEALAQEDQKLSEWLHEVDENLEALIEEEVLAEVLPREIGSIQIEEVRGYPGFEFLNRVRMEGVLELLADEKPALKAWVLRSLHEERANRILSDLSEAELSAVVWELGHLSLYEKGEILAEENRLKEKLNELPVEQKMGLRLASKTKAVVKLSTNMDFDYLQDLSLETLEAFGKELDLEDLAHALSHADKGVQEKILMALEPIRREEFLQLATQVKSNLEESLIHQERILVAFKAFDTSFERTSSKSA